MKQWMVLVTLEEGFPIPILWEMEDSQRWPTDSQRINNSPYMSPYFIITPRFTMVYSIAQGIRHRESACRSVFKFACLAIGINYVNYRAICLTKK